MKSFQKSVDMVGQTIYNKICKVNKLNKEETSMEISNHYDVKVKDGQVVECRLPIEKDKLTMDKLEELAYQGHKIVVEIGDKVYKDLKPAHFTKTL